MTWHALRVVVVALVLALLFAFPAGAQLPGRQPDTPTPDDISLWEVIGVAIRHRTSGEVFILPFPALVAPPPTDAPPTVAPSHTPSATPSPTLTATPTATATRTVTRTPTPTATVTPSATPGDVEPTPTPETAEPPPTFTVTPAPDKVCVIKTGAFGINERSDHDTGAPRVDVIPAGSIVTIEEFWQGDTYLWARSAIGWFVVREGSTWWVYGLEGTELCDEVQGWPTGLAPPVAIVGTAWGVWLGQGANVNEALALGEDIKAAGRTPAAVVYAYKDIAGQMAAAGWDVAYRPPYGDCPNMALDPATSARQRWQDAMRLSADVPYRYLILNNECIFPSVHWYRAYLDETITLAVADGKARGLVPHVAASGHFELEWYGVLYNAHRRLRDVGGAYGANLYPVFEGVNLCSSDPRVQWTTWRYELFADSLPPGLPIVVTEYARSWGASEPDFEDISCFARRADGWPVTFIAAWYAASPMHPWQAATLTGRLADLGAAYQRALG